MVPPPKNQVWFPAQILAAAALLVIVANINGGSPRGSVEVVFAAEVLKVSNAHERRTGRKLMDGLQNNMVQVCNIDYSIFTPTKIITRSCSLALFFFFL